MDDPPLLFFGVADDNSAGPLRLLSRRVLSCSRESLGDVAMTVAMSRLGGIDKDSARFDFGRRDSTATAAAAF
jgi:hypothetical protein